MKGLLFFLMVISTLLVYSQEIDKLEKNSVYRLSVKKSYKHEKIRQIPSPYPDEYYLKKNNVPDNFPRYKNTGNPKEDLNRYHNEKQKWIKENPEEYEKIKHLNL
ncbi:MAG: hypothetical protein N3A01_02985 [Bacteroidales bacterium]|nr:hypothetical protein [Bacteroidales bacterium]